MNKSNIDLCNALGVAVHVQQFDAGQTITLMVRRGEQPGYSGPFTVRITYLWGEEHLFNQQVRAWLDTVPWEGEDDPRA